MKTIVKLLMAAVMFLHVHYGNFDIMAQNHSHTDIEVSNSIIEAVNNIDIVSLNILLAGGAEIDTVDENGNTPLMLASKIGNLRMYRIIMAHNPDVNARNKMGESALIIASEHGQTEIVRSLIQNSANPNVRNNAGLSPADLAQRNGHSQIVHLFKNPNESPLSR